MQNHQISSISQGEEDILYYGRKALCIFRNAGYDGGQPGDKSHSVFHTASHRQLGAAAVQHGGLHRGQGNYVGDSALAAIGASGPILNLLLVLFMGVSVGASIMASQYFGAKDKKRLSHSVGTAITATFAVSIFVMVVGPLITHPIMSALQTPQDIYTMSCDYLIINFLGILGSAYYNIISGILRGLGDSVMPLIFLLVACGMNIGLDIWFVAGFKMGVAGAAWATIISQAVSGILCLVRLLLMA